MASNEIDIYGVLNAATIDGILAKAEQISMPKFDGTTDTVLNYIKHNVQFRSADEIEEYVASKSTDSLLFFAITENAVYKKSHIYYYSGINFQVEDLTPEGTAGGGGDSSKPVLTVTTNFKDEYPLNETITINYYWSSKNTGIGRIYGIVDGNTMLSRREYPTALTGSTSKTWDIKNLSRGKHVIEMYVVDSANTASSPRFTTAIIVGGLDVELTYDESSYQYANKDLVIPYNILNSTSDSARLYAAIDEGDEFLVTDEKNITIPAVLMTSGNHTLYLRVETYKIKDDIETVVKTSDKKSYRIVAAEEGKVYVTAYYNSTQVSDKPEDVIKVSTEDGQEVQFRYNIIEINGSTYYTTYYLDTYDQTFNNCIATTKLGSVYDNIGVRAYARTFTEGYYKLRIEVVSITTGSTSSCEFELTIVKSSLYTIDPITDGLQLWLDSYGRSNNSDDKTEWIDKSGNNVNVELHDFNYSNNGWVLNKDGTSANYLLINSRAYVKINLEPFAKEIDDGLTVDIEFETQDICNADARVISCYGKPIGFFANTSTARLGSSASPTETVYKTEIKKDEFGEEYERTDKTGPFEIDFRQNTRTHLTYVIYRNKTGNETENESYPIPVMAMYINGILTGVQTINAAADSFRSLPGQYIYLGCSPHIKDVTDKTDTVANGVLENFGECKIYNLRVYNRALTAKEVVTNYIYDIKDQDTQQNKIKSNKLGQAANDTKKLIPEMTFTMFDSDFGAVSKASRQRAVINYVPTDGGSLSFDDFGTIQWQGTSTLAYAVKNYKIFLYSSNDVSNVPPKITIGEDGEEIEEPLSQTEATKILFSSAANLKAYGAKHNIDIGNGMKESKFTLKADLKNPY